MASEPDAPYADLAAEIRPAILRINRRFRLVSRIGAYSLTQLAALSSVDNHGPLSAGDLAAIERVQPPSMTKVIASLEADGLVRRDTHPTDKRQAIITITPKGSELLASSRRTGEEWFGTQLAQLTDAEREQLHALAPILAKITEAD